MYATCLFCHARLGRNDAVEHFPVGRRLAFDAATGRLWVVCRGCERWNLTPVEERWEALEEAERLYRAAPQRASTGNIGLARLPDGTELVRVGAALRPEFAAWRYGDRFAQRRRRARAAALGTAGAAAGTVALATVGPGAGALSAALTLALWVPTQFLLSWHRAGLLGRLVLRDDNGQPFEVDARVALEARLAAGVTGAPTLTVHYFNNLDLRAGFRDERDIRLTGPHAVEVAGRLLSRVNGAGAPAARIAESVGLLEAAGGPDRFWRDAAANVRRWAGAQTWGDTGALRHLPAPVRLALEMAAHEASERRALEGELAELERAWRDAEEVAAIADNLLLPAPVQQAWERLRQRGRR